MYKIRYMRGRIAMEAVTYSTFRKDLRHYLDKTRDDAEAVLVTSKDPESNVVVMNQRDYDNLMENLRIMSNEGLMERIRRGREQFRNGQTTPHDLLGDDE